MAITTVDGIIAGCKPPVFFYKAIQSQVAGRPYSYFYSSGIPGAAAAPTPGISGEALTSYPGQIPFTNPVSGNSYLARFSGLSTGQSGTLLLVDRLWHNSGITITAGTTTVNSVTFPSRDNNGSTNGEGVLVGFEVSTATSGSGTPTVSISYTNSDGTSSRSGSTFITTSTSLAIGSFFQIGLQGADKGVRSIQSVTLTSGWTSGTIHLVAYRVIASLQCSGSSIAAVADPLTGGLPRLYDNTVPFLLFIPNTTTGTAPIGTITVTQG